MEYVPTAIPEVVLLKPKVFGDARGFFLETFRQSEFDAFCGHQDFVQDNHSGSRRGILRGLHYQLRQTQGKLVRAAVGEVFDVAVDIRRSSPTFGKHVAVELSAENWLQMYVPVGFAHGFVTREPDTEVSYKVSTPYTPACDRGLAWDDPALGIDWGIAPEHAVLSNKDRHWPRLTELGNPF